MVDDVTATWSCKSKAKGEERRYCKLGRDIINYLPALNFFECILEKYLVIKNRSKLSSKY
jgi:hypothetical protein